MAEKNWSSRTKHNLIIEVWEDLDCESVGAREIEEIQRALGEKFGAGALTSPAAIARTVADEGAVLRHPEVFECDSKWREQKMDRRVFRDGVNFGDLSLAFASVVKLEEKRLELQLNDDAIGLKELREIVMAERKDLLMQSRSRIIDGAAREQLKEVSQWLTVWLQSPELFSDWLDLRRRSPEFRERFDKAPE